MIAGKVLEILGEEGRGLEWEPEAMEQETDLEAMEEELELKAIGEEGMD